MIVEPRATAAAPQLALAKIARTYPGSPPVEALLPTTLTVDAGELLGIVGRSGSGKSTLLNVLGLLDTPTAGSYKIRGIDVGGLSEADRAALRSWFLGFVFQQAHMLTTHTVRENVELALLPRGCGAQERRGRAMDALDRVGLVYRQNAGPSTLSGGEAQRVAIARALAQRPEVLLCDEPTGNLDASTSANVIELLRDLNGDGLTVVIVTHDVGIASLLPRLLTVADGHVTESPRAARPVGPVGRVGPVRR